MRGTSGSSAAGGAGFLYVRKDIINEVEPVQFGYRSVEEHDMSDPG